MERAAVMQSASAGVIDVDSPLPPPQDDGNDDRDRDDREHGFLGGLRNGREPRNADSREQQQQREQSTAAVVDTSRRRRRRPECAHPATTALAPPISSSSSSVSSRSPPPPRVLILCGLPGSGKSTFAHRLLALAARDTTWVRVCQDELGSREKCKAATHAALFATPPRNVLVDRCNFDAEQRAPWIELARARGAEVAVGAVVFRVPLAECVRRARARGDAHPTLVDGVTGDAQAAVAQFAARWCNPSPREGIRFCRVVTTTTTEADVQRVLDEVLQR